MRRTWAGIVAGATAIALAVAGCVSGLAEAAPWEGVGIVPGPPETGGEREYWIDIGSLRQEGDITWAEILVVYQHPVHESWLSQVNAGEFRCVRFETRETSMRAYRSRLPVGQPVKEVTAGMEWERGTRDTIGGDIVEAACKERAASDTPRTHQWELLTTSSGHDEIYVDRKSMRWNGAFRELEVAMTRTETGERGAKSYRSRMAFDCVGARAMELGARGYATRGGAAFDEELLESVAPVLTGSEHAWASIPSSGVIPVIAGAVCPSKVPSDQGK